MQGFVSGLPEMLKFLAVALALLVGTIFFALATQTWLVSGQQTPDASDQPLLVSSIMFLKAGTTTPLAVYADAGPRKRLPVSLRGIRSSGGNSPKFTFIGLNERGTLASAASLAST